MQNGFFDPFRASQYPNFMSPAGTFGPMNVTPVPNYTSPSSNHVNPSPNYTNPSSDHVNPSPNYTNPSSNYVNPGPNYVNPYGNPKNPKLSSYAQNLKDAVLSAINPLVQYGLKEGKHTSVPHALQETAAIAYLMGKGNDFKSARRIVESWEIDETF